MDSAQNRLFSFSMYFVVVLFRNVDHFVSSVKKSSINQSIIDHCISGGIVQYLRLGSRWVRHASRLCESLPRGVTSSLATRHVIGWIWVAMRDASHVKQTLTGLFHNGCVTLHVCDAARVASCRDAASDASHVTQVCGPIGGGGALCIAPLRQSILQWPQHAN